MAKVLILTLVFPPDSVSTAHIMGDLASGLSALGHSVQVLTTVPHYNSDLEGEARQPLRSMCGGILRRSDYRGIPVYHTYMPRKGTKLWSRVMAWLGFHAISLFAGMTVIRRADVIIAPSPPLTIGVCAWLLSLFHRCSYIYNVQEIYPDIAISLGMLRSRRLIRLLLTLERFVYNKARIVTVIAPRMRDQLLAKGVPGEKVEFVPNFADVDRLYPQSKDNPFSSRYELAAKFVVSYAGNLGPAQSLESFVSAAGLLRDEKGIVFLMLGDGILRDKLANQVAALRLENFVSLEYQPYELMGQIYAASDLCLAPLAAHVRSDAVPSKVYRIMACARPVLVAAEPSCDLADLIRSVGCGAVVPPDSPEALAEAILDAYRNPGQWRRMGEAGREHVLKHYTGPIITQQYHRLVQDAVGRSNGKGG